MDERQKRKMRKILLISVLLAASAIGYSNNTTNYDEERGYAHVKASDLAGTEFNNDVKDEEDDQITYVSFSKPSGIEVFVSSTQKASQFLKDKKLKKSTRKMIKISDYAGLFEGEIRGNTLIIGNFQFKIDNLGNNRYKIVSLSKGNSKYITLNNPMETECIPATVDEGSTLRIEPVCYDDEMDD